MSPNLTRRSPAPPTGRQQGTGKGGSTSYFRRRDGRRGTASQTPSFPSHIPDPGSFFPHGQPRLPAGTPTTPPQTSRRPSLGAPATLSTAALLSQRPRNTLPPRGRVTAMTPPGKLILKDNFVSSSRPGRAGRQHPARPSLP